MFKRTRGRTRRSLLVLGLRLARQVEAWEADGAHAPLVSNVPRDSDP